MDSFSRSGPSTPRDILYVGGSLTAFAGPQETRGAHAVAVRDGIIVAIGDAREARDALHASAAVVDLGSGHILPGINDSHAHLVSWGASLPPFAVDLSYPGVRSIEDALARIAAHAATLPAGSWIRGSGWSPSTLRECVETPGRMPTRAELDRVSPDHPVVLDDDSLHAYWVNTAALRLAGIDASTPDPAGGTIARDEHGAPTGILIEFSARALIDRVVPALTRAERRDAITRAIVELHRLGITSATDPAIGPGGGSSPMGTESLYAYEELARAGQLGVRMSLLLLPGEDGVVTAELVERDLHTIRLDSSDPRRLRLAGVKVFADGIPPLHTAWLHHPYRDEDTRGSLSIPGADDAGRVAELAAIVRVAHRAGMQLGVHATGDAAIDAAVEAMVAAARGKPGTDPRHYIIHGDLISTGTIAQLARHGIGLNTQMELQAYVQEQMEGLVGIGRSEHQWPCRTLLSAGVHVAFSSDVPASPSADWRRGASVAVLRTSALTGRVSGAAERVTLEEALRAYTATGAWQDHAESWKGALAVGQVADLCVLEADPFARPVEELPELAVTGTMVGGELVFSG